MRARTPLLVVGSAGLREAAGRALPCAEIRGADSLLSGLWLLSQEAYQAALVSLTAGANARMALVAMRRVAPHARIIVCCVPADEPTARALVQQGANDYILEPVSREELEKALQLVPEQTNRPAGRDGPSVDEYVQLGAILRGLPDGPQPTLDRLAALIRDVFQAGGAHIQLDDLSSTLGESGPVVLEQPICRGEQAVGRIALPAGAAGPYDAATAARLAEYARLIDAYVSQAREQEHWRTLAWSDEVSGLHNRRYFDHKLDDLLRQATEQRLRLTVFIFDIDDFKSYNDTYGHEVGDALLHEVGFLLRRVTRESDVVARYGGDEFAVVFWEAEKPRVPGSAHPSEPLALAERFGQAIAAHSFQCLGPRGPGRATISGGLSCFPWDGVTREQLLRAADEALMSAKRTGKNRIVLASGPNDDPIRDRIDG